VDTQVPKGEGPGAPAFVPVAEESQYRGPSPSTALRVRMTGVEVVWAKNGRIRRFFAALRMTAERGVAR